MKHWSLFTPLCSTINILRPAEIYVKCKDYKRPLWLEENHQIGPDTGHENNSKMSEEMHRNALFEIYIYTS